MRVSQGCIHTDFLVEHKNFIENEQFCDFQIEGPMNFYEQAHRFIPESENSSFLEDQAEYELPLGFPVEYPANLVVSVEFERLFRYRHHVLEADLNFAHQHKEAEPMKIAVTGSTGLVGSSLVPFLTTQGHSVKRFVRAASNSSPTAPGESAVWNPATGALDVADLEGCEAVVHLAGENIGSSRWNDEKKKQMRDSRINSTKLLVERMSQMKEPPKVFLCASAIGYYGDSGDTILSEKSEKGKGYLADLCDEWEQTAKVAQKAGIRVVNYRLGVILSPKSGALQKMLLPFQMGGGGLIGSGKQYFSWIAIDDVIGSILHCLLTPSLSGPVNAVAPNTVSNEEYTHALGSVLQRPTILPMPAFAARMAFGEFADECLLASQRVVPDLLNQTAYQFRYRNIEPALRHLLGKEATPVGASAKQ